MVAISVISPSFNQAQFVQRTLDSIAAQDTSDIEHIVFDGGSTDGTLDILTRAAAAGNRLSLHVGRDSGQTNAINLGLQEAKGDILTWLNTDDRYVDSGVLSEVARVFRANPDCDVVYGRGRFVSPEGDTLRDVYINDAPQALVYRFINSVGILQPALFFRRKVIETFGYLDERMSCAFDYEYWVRLVSGGAKFVFLDRFLVDAIWHEDMKTSAKRGQSFEESIEVCRRYFGFSPLEWVERHSGHLIAGSDYVMTDKSKGDRALQTEIERHAAASFRKRNEESSARSAILRWAHANEAGRSLKEMQRGTQLSWDRVIVTTFDEAYFEQGLTLIASLHRTCSKSIPIVVYDLGLSTSRRAMLCSLRSVFVVDYPRDIAPSYSAFFAPKSYVYKILALHHAAHFVGKDGLVLWVDAGVSAATSLDAVFDRIAQDEVFFVDHDDRPMWPMFNLTFTSDACVEAMDPTNDELVGLHLCSCLMGFKVGGRFQALFSDALRYAAIEGAALGDKHPLPPVRIEPAKSGQEAHRRQRAIKNARFRAGLDRIELRSLFGYLGHRQDQTILSILAARHGAPLSSARKYCVASAESSTASKLNWESGGFSSKVKPSRTAANGFERSISIHHRGIYMNLEQLDFGVAVNRPAIVLGNGPSLKGFDFERFKPFDVFGMNAAYRYWDQIGWYPRFYSCLDQVVGISHAEEIARLIRSAPKYGIERFLLRRKLIDHIGEIENADRIVDFDLLRVGTHQFSTLPLTTGSHTLIWAASLGFRQIYILGVDCNYVEIVPGAERREGAVLEITRAADNPNYFFSGYQRVGDKYNVPNSTSPELHLDSWRAAATPAREYGARVLNANLKSRVDAFDFCRFEDAEQGGHVGIIPRGQILKEKAYYAPSDFCSVALERSDVAQIDECNVVFSVLQKPRKSGIMLDVGAHRGGTLKRFAEAGWNVFAFEPDPGNRDKLVSAFGARSNVLISDEALSDQAEQQVPFFASQESTGISGLSAFRESHHEVARVTTVTLNDVVARHGLTHIDFLKIDVEGFEMAVLRGLDFARVKPMAIEVEFEDGKSKSVSHTSHDLACFLMSKGYSVYVSEWHPIERYGVKHSWHRIQKYPCAIPEESWGNLIAFIEDPSATDLIRAVRDAVDRPVRFASQADESTGQVTAPITSAAKRKRTEVKNRKRSPGLMATACIVALVVIAAAAVWVLPTAGALLTVLTVNLLISALMIRRKSKSLKKLGRRQKRALGGQIKALQLQIKNQGEQLQRRAHAQEQTVKQIDAQNRAFSRLNAANAVRARVHARLLEDAALERLERHWAPLFGQAFRPSALSYLAHQICLSEDRCEGRLATTIDTVMLRLMALRSLKGPHVEMLEIGTLFGLGAGLLHRHRGDGIGHLRLTLIDPLNGYYGAGEPDPITGVAVGPETLMRNLAALGVPSEDVRVLRGLSTDPEIVAAAQQGTYDLLVVDGDHSGAGVRRDFELYGPMIRPGGLVLFDDYDTRDWPEIKPSVDAVMAETDGWEWLGADWRTGIARRTAGRT